MFTSYQSQILAILSSTPEKEYYLSELGEMLGKHPGVFQRGLNSLEKQGWIMSRKRGGQRLFKINSSHPLFKEIKSVAHKTAGVEAELKKMIDGLHAIKIAFIYGSYAKDHLRPSSDIDVLVVVNFKDAGAQGIEDQLVDELTRREKSLGRDINYKLYEEKDFKKRRKLKDPFLTEILSDKYIMIKGTL